MKRNKAVYELLIYNVFCICRCSAYLINKFSFGLDPWWMWKNCHIWWYTLVESRVKSNAEGLDETTPLLAKVYPFLKLSTDENSIISQDHLHQGLAIFIISRFFLFISPFCELHPTTSWHLFGKYKEQFIVFAFATTFPFFLFIYFFQTIMLACLCFHRIK